MRLSAAITTILCWAWPAGALAEEAAAAADPGFVSILPPLVAIVAALVFRQVIPALFFGVWLGAAAVGGLSLASVWTGLLDAVQVYVVGAVADADHVAIIIFSLLIGGMVGIVSRAGGALGVVDHVVRFATDHRRAQLGMTGLGLAIFFDDYTNTLVVGNTMRPVADRLRVSREKLAYIVDTTAAPITAVAFVTTWIGYEVGLIDAALAAIDSMQKPYLVLVHAVGYCYYPVLALVFALMVAASGRDFGPMRLAESRARRQEAGEGEEASAPAGSDIDPRPGVEGRALVAIVPIGVLLVAVVTGLIVTGEGDSFRDIIGSADSYKALVWASLLGALVAGAVAIGSRALDVAETVDAWLAGINAMMMGIIVLVLAWSLSAVAASLGTADYLVELLGDAVPAPLLPTLVFLLACAIAFATGTSWGTLGILMPLVVPLTWAIAGGSGDATSLPILYSAIACVLAGAVWGDHCSPISDTTIMSSMSSGCDHVAHVRTQMPYALLVGGVAVACGTLPAGFGMPWWLGLPLGTVAMWLALRIFGREG
jgi:Na+/H+ antiporter NhaC